MDNVVSRGPTVGNRAWGRGFQSKTSALSTLVRLPLTLAGREFLTGKALLRITCETGLDAWRARTLGEALIM
jgi:hypothetical protein